MIEADGILLGSPMYFADVSAGMKALIERCGMVSRANGDLFKCHSRLSGIFFCKTLATGKDYGQAGMTNKEGL